MLAKVKCCRLGAGRSDHLVDSPSAEQSKWEEEGAAILGDEASIRRPDCSLSSNMSKPRARSRSPAPSPGVRDSHCAPFSPHSSVKGDPEGLTPSQPGNSESHPPGLSQRPGCLRPLLWRLGAAGANKRRHKAEGTTRHHRRRHHRGRHRRRHRAPSPRAPPCRFLSAFPLGDEKAPTGLQVTGSKPRQPTC